MFDRHFRWFVNDGVAQLSNIFLLSLSLGPPCCCCCFCLSVPNFSFFHVRRGFCFSLRASTNNIDRENGLKSLYLLRDFLYSIVIGPVVYQGKKK